MFHATSAPVTTITIGIFFLITVILIGSWFMGIIQISIDPEIIDIEDRTNIGEISEFSSWSWINGVEFEGPQMVVNINRAV